MHRFIINNRIIDGRAPLPDEEAKHALKVLRLTHGDAIEVSDGAGDVFSARLIIDACGRAYAEIGDMLPDTEANVRVTLYQGLPKADKLEFITQKLTELGAAKIVPVRMRRCVMRIGDADAPKKLERLNRISREAGKQSGRARDMEIAPPMDFGAALKAFGAHELKLAPWEDARGARLMDARADKPAVTDIAYIIGPEGGMTPDEARALNNAGAKLISLGPRILRTETAAVAACAIIMSLWGDI